MPVLVLILLISILDQATKIAVRRFFGLGESLEIIRGFFDITHARNTGAAFGAFHGSNYLLAAFSAAVLAALFVFRRSLYGPALRHRLALGLLAGGILGNLFDRIRWGYVVDFLDFYWKERHFPAFNVADSCICIGVALYLLNSWLDRAAQHGGGADAAMQPGKKDKP